MSSKAHLKFVDELIAFKTKHEKQKAEVKEMDNDRKAKYFDGEDLDYAEMYHKLDEMRDSINSAAEGLKAAEYTDDPEHRQSLLHDAAYDVYENWHLRDMHDVMCEYAENIELENDDE